MARKKLIFAIGVLAVTNSLACAESSLKPSEVEALVSFVAKEYTAAGYAIVNSSVSDWPI